MQKDALEFLFKLLETPSPSGFESAIQRVVRKRVQGFADSVRVDVHGNLIATVNENAPLRVVLAGHCDQIGLMVSHIDERGYLYVGAIGGIDPAVLPGTRVTVLTDSGPVVGVLGCRPVHLIPQADRGKQLELKKIWVDIGAKDGKEAKSIIAVGDPLVFVSGAERLGKHAITAPACDDRVGVFVVMEALRLFKQQIGRKRSPVSVFAVSTVQEELGLRGAQTSCFGIDPIAGVAVDVHHATDNPGAEEIEVGTLKLGAGPGISKGANINPMLRGILTAAAKKLRLPHQSVPAPRATGTDANAIQISRAGVATALVNIPLRYMHTPVEVVDLRDLDRAAKLIAVSLLSITAKTRFEPL